jgi:23S rRNA pseudouridine955/2504/2580 synthase
MADRKSNSTPASPRPVAARMVTADADAVGRRLDNFLMGQLKGLPRSRIYRIIRSGEVRVNKGRVKPAYRLVEGDIVRLPPVYGLSEGDSHKISQDRASWVTEHILYEDSCLLVLDKPSGLAVHGGSGISLGAIELLRAARPDNRYLELVHRLDRATSGCLLIAKKRSSLRRLHEAFREGRVRKIYQALLMGEWTGGKREVSLALVTDHRQNGERHVRPGEEGKAALTRFYPEKVYQDAVLVRVELLTGRTHQIRAHAAAIGHPVAGDERYGNSEISPRGLKRLFLHASQLSIEHPDDGRRITFESPLEPGLRNVLAKLPT